ncbi:MAG TPA: hypothetical protein VFQ49_04755, partial [Actinomycetes bacterium]|nr:hypothetical protein [Actinomycetes bacterium]
AARSGRRRPARRSPGEAEHQAAAAYPAALTGAGADGQGRARGTAVASWWLVAGHLPPEVLPPG